MEDVLIDGVDMGVVDLYSPAQKWQIAKSYTGLSSGSHTIKVKVLGTKNAAATGSQVVVDAYIINP